jgi:hypothetical protein
MYHWLRVDRPLPSSTAPSAEESTSPRPALVSKLSGEITDEIVFGALVHATEQHNGSSAIQSDRSVLLEYDPNKIHFECAVEIAMNVREEHANAPDLG